MCAQIIHLKTISTTDMKFILPKPNKRSRGSFNTFYRLFIAIQQTICIAISIEIEGSELKSLRRLYIAFLALVCVWGYGNWIFKNKHKFRLQLQCNFKLQRMSYQKEKEEEEMTFLYATQYKIIIKFTFEIQCSPEFWWVFTYKVDSVRRHQLYSKHFTVFIQCYVWIKSTKYN